MKKTLAVLATFAIAAGFAAAKEDVPNASLSEVRFGGVVNGVEFDRAELDGKVVVVEKWGTRCGPCIAFLPELAKIAKRYEKKGLAVVGMEVQNSKKDAIVDVLDDARVKYPVVAGGSTPVSAGTIPFACVFGADGKLLWSGNPHNDGFLKSIKKGLRDKKDMPSPSTAASVDKTTAGPLIASREWTNTDGKTIRAEVMRVEDANVVFRMSGGREVPYEIAKLSEDDQKLIREAANE